MFYVTLLTAFLNDSIEHSLTLRHLACTVNLSNDQLAFSEIAIGVVSEKRLYVKILFIVSTGD